MVVGRNFIPLQKAKFRSQPCLRNRQKIRIPLLVFLLFAHFIALEQHANAQDKVVRYGVGTGFKQRFPNTDGIGWSESFFKVIFESAGYRLEVNEYPSKRLPYMLENGTIDGFVSSTESLGEKSSDFLRSKFPTTNLSYYIYYKKDGGWQPSWPPNDIFARKRGRSKASPVALQYATALNIKPTWTFESCILMVHAGRTDYWLDNITGRLNTAPGLIKSPADGYSYERLFDWGIYINFQNSERGRKLKSLYDEGFQQILLQGDYIRIYYQFTDPPTSTAGAEGGVSYIRQLFPELDFPPQKALE